MKSLMRLISYIAVAVISCMLTLTMLGQHTTGGYSKLEQIGQIVDQYFIGDADTEAMLDSAASGMIEALDDRWSYYMTADEYQSYLEQMKNAYVGIGVTITVREDGYIEVVKVTEGGPAQEAGVSVGDLIVAVEGKDISTLELEDVKSRIRGTSGTQVNITVRTGGEDRILEITRKHIETVVATGKLLENNIGLVTIINFDKRCAQETIGHIEDLLAQGAQALIFDVRFNPGGYKDELVKVLDYLLPEGPLFRSVDYQGKETVDTSDAKCLDIPMAVLINDNSYSAAEFFAAALDEYEAAFTVGTPTTGKGRFQTSFDLADGSAIVLSVGEYSTPKGVCLADTGLTPDIVVELDEETYTQVYYAALDSELDPQIQAAVRGLLD